MVDQVCKAATCTCAEMMIDDQSRETVEAVTCLVCGGAAEFSDDQLNEIIALNDNLMDEIAKQRAIRQQSRKEQIAAEKRTAEGLKEVVL